MTETVFALFLDELQRLFAQFFFAVYLENLKRSYLKQTRLFPDKLHEKHKNAHLMVHLPRFVCFFSDRRRQEGAITVFREGAKLWTAQRW
jgi:hypothetical protein